ncbi:hypothetical protein Tco_0610374 [Tanacetum coccineum]
MIYAQMISERVRWVGGGAILWVEVGMWCIGRVGEGVLLSTRGGGDCDRFGYVIVWGGSYLLALVWMMPGATTGPSNSDLLPGSATTDVLLLTSVDYYLSALVQESCKSGVKQSYCTPVCKAQVIRTNFANKAKAVSTITTLPAKRVLHEYTLRKCRQGMWRDITYILMSLDGSPIELERSNTQGSAMRCDESAPDLFTSITVEDATMKGSFHTSPPRSTQAPLEGTTSGGAEDLDKLTALSFLVSTLVQKVNTQESKLKTHKLLFKDVVGKLVQKVKLLEDKLKGRNRKFVMTDSDKEEDAESDVDPLIKLAKAAATAAAALAVPTGGSHEANIPPSSSIPSDAFTGGSDALAGATTVPVAKTIPAGSGTTPESTSSPVRDAKKGKGIAVNEPTPTHHKTFKQLEEERLARQMSQDFEMTEDQRKRQQEVLASAANYSDAAWDIILARLQENPDLTSNTRRKELVEQRAQERKERPMTPSQLRQYMRTYVKNQGPAVYFTGWTMAQIRKLSPEQLQEEFDKIQRVVAFTRSFKRDDSPMTRASSKKFKTGDNDVNVEAPSHGVPQEEEGATPSQNVSREEVAAPSHSQDIPNAQTEVPSQKAPIEDVEVPSHFASIAQHTASSLRKVGTKKKRLGRKGVNTSHSTIPIEDGDPEAEHKMCIKYASDADSASDDDTPVNFYAVVDWELLPTWLGSINDNQVVGVVLVLWGDLKVLIDSLEVNDGSDVWKNQHTWRIQSWKLYSFSGVHVLETVDGLVLHMFVDKKYPLSVNLIERMLDHQLEICHGIVGNELTTAVQLIAFLKKQISDSKRPKVHDCPRFYVDCLVADSTHIKVAFGDGI